MEARRFFQPVSDRKAKSRVIRALGVDLRHARHVKLAQSVKDAARLLGLVSLGAEVMDDAPRKQRAVFGKADNARALLRMACDIVGAFSPSPVTTVTGAFGA